MMHKPLNSFDEMLLNIVEIKKLNAFSALTINNVNEHLKQGWKILALFRESEVDVGDTQQSIGYIMGRPDGVHPYVEPDPLSPEERARHEAQLETYMKEHPEWFE
ncbi:MAG: hypothetical protein Q4C86_10585 [bacterium]|nr:hypothetical protein [bacterium]